MTVGKDVSQLFPDVINCMQTDNLELKKLVYLYLMNYAKSQADMAILAVSTLVKVQLLHSSKNDLRQDRDLIDLGLSRSQSVDSCTRCAYDGLYSCG